ncbi:right-handed parallel beta-helix repeat-containing protein [Sphingobacterium sp. ML3W]|uniref:right-handed parallel beta-helix repeat-containing protein n=1 Tax=Sphingobacterium sp. ML3W TaxID=1538644 RepID=UPI00249B0888|nr:right-handed parallel beta-helix repeat-containing protein [Sphingobacterium sp. ML3W]WFA79518.1 right-handed parallel beta-helix repeat-containing protein [Sphingobacterium sp. ML3W]
MANQLLIKKTMADMRALSAAEITGLQNNTYDGIQLLGYYLAGDTPDPIIYYPSTTTATDNGGSVIVIGTITLEHNFNSEIDVRYFGAFPNVTALDEINTTETPSDNVTNKIQNALDLGGNVFLPKGRYYINFNQGLFISKSGTNFYGDKGLSILVGGNRNRRSDGFYYRTLNIVNFDTLNVDSVKIFDLCFERKAEAWINDQDQFYHHINILGGSNIDIYAVKIFGALGDGICLGGNTNQTEELTKKIFNSNVSIHDCFVDGRNNQNRNGISIVDGESIRIFNNTIQNFTRADMPGGIDIEPNDKPNYIIRNIFIENNILRNIGGMAGVIGCYGSPDPKIVEPNSIFIRNNQILGGGTTKNKFSFFVDMKASPKDQTTNTPSNNIVFEGNLIQEGTGDRLFLLYGVKDIIINNNIFEKYTEGGFISFIGGIPSATMCINVHIENNLFKQGKSTPCLRFSYINGLKIRNNTFRDAATTTILDIPAGADVRNVSIQGNSFENINNTATYYLHLSADPSTTVDMDAIYIGDNYINGNLINILKINKKGAPSIQKNIDVIYSGNADFGDLRIYSPSSVAESNRTVNSRVGINFKSDSASGNSLWRDLQIIKVANTINLPTANAVNGEMVWDANEERPKWFFNNGWRDLLAPASPLTYGRVKQSAASPDSASTPSAIYTQAEIQAILVELRDLKLKLRASGILAS